MNALEVTLASGVTTLCRCWAVSRRDGQVLGFTDHDLPLQFEGIEFRADAGLTASEIAQTTGLSVDNTEAMGALSDPLINEIDIDAGKYDGAEVREWLVNWADVTERRLRFRGTIGEIRRGSGAFHAELRGLTEVLNQPQGHIYQRSCGAVLGDARCRFDLTTAGFFEERVFEQIETARVFTFSNMGNFPLGWFEGGRLIVTSGDAAGLDAVIKRDSFQSDGSRQFVLWEGLGVLPETGDQLRLEAGCDRRFATCQAKFANHENFRGFPDIPGEDWLVSVPARAASQDGGSLR